MQTDNGRFGRDPLIVTAAFDARSAAYFQDLRARHFPPNLNIVPAHLTLFHHLPGPELPMIIADLDSVCAAHHQFPFLVGGVRSLGRGVALNIQAPILDAIRQRLAVAWSAWLTPQDRQGFRPHVTIQNKVSSEEARLLLRQLDGLPMTEAGTVVGLDLWHYRGGPWESAGRRHFKP